MGLAAAGSRQLGASIETIEDREELAQVRRQAFQVYLKASAAAVMPTLLTLLI